MEPPSKPQHFTRRSKRLVGDTTTHAPSSTAILAHSAVIPVPSVSSTTTFHSQPTSTTKVSSPSRQSSFQTAKPLFTTLIPPLHPSANLPQWKSVVPPILPQIETHPDSSLIAQFQVSHRKASVASSSNSTRVSTRLKSQHNTPLMVPSLSPSSAETLDPDPISQAAREEAGLVDDSSESDDEDMIDMEGTDESMDDDDAPAEVAVSARAKGTTKPSRCAPIRNPTDCTLIDRTKNMLFPTTAP